jgi:hypothetical protein
VLIALLGITWGPERDTIVGISFFVLYHTVSLSISSTTLGKALFGLRVIDAKTQDRLNVGKALGRSLSYLISSLALGLGFITIAFDKNKQGWHDKIAKTIVVRKDKRLFWPIFLTLLSLGFVIFSLSYTYSEDYSYLPARSAQILRSLDDFLSGQPSNFQSLLSSASSNDRDYQINSSGGQMTKT